MHKHKQCFNITKFTIVAQVKRKEKKNQSKIAFRNVVETIFFKKLIFFLIFLCFWMVLKLMSKSFLKNKIKILF
jgi:hypothetical protein